MQSVTPVTVIHLIASAQSHCPWITSIFSGPSGNRGASLGARRRRSDTEPQDRPPPQA